MDVGPFEHNQIEANSISIHAVSVGQGPLVVFCHGFPESWYSWRHQLPAVAAAGFRAVALDMRGYGGTTAPPAVAGYSLSHLVGDVVGAVAALGEKQAVVVGHDWGAPVAWYSALMRPDVFRAVVGMSVPYIPPVVLPAGLTMRDLMRAHQGPLDRGERTDQARRRLQPRRELEALHRRRPQPVHRAEPRLGRPLAQAFMKELG